MRGPDHVARARAALALCTPAERAALFRESGECLCQSTARLAREHPRLATGAAIGAVVAALLGPVERNVVRGMGVVVKKDGSER